LRISSILNEKMYIFIENIDFNGVTDKKYNQGRDR
jgi:hypothetical protein